MSMVEFAYVLAAGMVTVIILIRLLAAIECFIMYRRACTGDEVMELFVVAAIWVAYYFNFVKR